MPPWSSSIITSRTASMTERTGRSLLRHNVGPRIEKSLKVPINAETAEVRTSPPRDQPIEGSSLQRNKAKRVPFARRIGRKSFSPVMV